MKLQRIRIVFIPFGYPSNLIPRMISDNYYKVNVVFALL